MSCNTILERIMKEIEEMKKEILYLKGHVAQLITDKLHKKDEE